MTATGATTRIGAALAAVPPEELPVAALAAVAGDPGPDGPGRRDRDGGRTLDVIRDSAAGCRACDLWARAAQTVFGRGPVPARLMLVGEQPGDREDLAGEPFVGPAGSVLAAAMADAGMDREQAFVTNVVKHFKWRPSGKRRLHERPNRVEVGACLPWVETELALVRPEALVLLGSTAATTLAGPGFSVLRERGRPLSLPHAPLVLATVHPSSILRAGPGRDAARAAFVRDLRVVARWLEDRPA